MDLTRYAITYDRVTVAVVVTLLLGGIGAFLTMEQAHLCVVTSTTAQE